MKTLLEFLGKGLKKGEIAHYYDLIRYFYTFVVLFTIFLQTINI